MHINRDYTREGVISPIPILVGVDEDHKVKKMKGYQKEGMAVGLFSFASINRTFYISHGPVCFFLY